MVPDARLLALVSASKRLLVISGAGVSTSSGIPDYRSPGRPPHKPMTQNEFASSASIRARYWARSFLGWPAFARSTPNAAHHALAALEARGVVRSLITQNVDELHARAGHRSILELHGTLHVVDCTVCGAATSRADVQAALEVANTAWRATLGPPPPGASSALMSGAARPDGDATLDNDAVRSFRPPVCSSCGGFTLQPRVVFFGGTVPPSVVSASRALVTDADAVLLVGSTASTLSALRLIRDAAAAGKPIGILNKGATRADDLASVHVEADVGTELEALRDAL